MITIEKYILNIKFKIYIYISILVVNRIQSQEEPPVILKYFSPPDGVLRERLTDCLLPRAQRQRLLRRKRKVTSVVIFFPNHS